MLNINSKKFAFLFFLIYFFSFALSVSAAGLVPCNGLDCKPCDLFVGFVNVINFLVFTIAPIAAAIMAVIAGLILIFGGSETAKTMGKKMLTNTVIGLVIVLCSWLIVNTIIRAIGRGTSGWSPAGWNQIQCVK